MLGKLCQMGFIFQSPLFTSGLTWLFVAIFLLSGQRFCYGQMKNELSVEVGRQFATTGDLSGNLIQGTYNRIVFKRVSIGVGYSHFHASGEDFPFYETDTSTAVYTINLNSQSGLPSQYPTNYSSYRLWKVRREHTDQLNWRNVRLSAGFYIKLPARFYLKPTVGLGLGFLERNFIVLHESAGIVSYFDGVERRAVIVTSLYARGLDIHYHASLQAGYRINNRISLSLAYLIDMYRTSFDWNRGWALGAVSSF